MVDLLVTQNTTGNSLTDPEIVATEVSELSLKNAIAAVNPVGDKLMLHCASSLIGKKIEVSCYNTSGQIVLQKTLSVDNALAEIPFNVNAGVYFLRITASGQTINQQTIIKS